MAQMELYDRYFKAMYNTAHRIVKDSFEAEDIVQESFLTAFEKLGRLKEPEMFGPWLKKIVANNSIGSYRSKQKNNEVPMEDGYLKDEENNYGEENSGFTALKVKQVMQTLEKLKENYRVALTLHLIEGYDYDEISGIMGISNGSCRTIISRAKESLRKKLQALAA